MYLRSIRSVTKMDRLTNTTIREEIGREGIKGKPSRTWNGVWRIFFLKMPLVERNEPCYIELGRPASQMVVENDVL